MYFSFRANESFEDGFVTNASLLVDPFSLQKNAPRGMNDSKNVHQSYVGHIFDFLIVL